MRVLSKTACVVVYCLWAITQPVLAGYYSCDTGNGVVFQDTPCTLTPASKSKQQTSRPQKSSRYPSAIDKSWLEKPRNTAYTAWCDTNGCECGPYQRSFDAGAALAVADALYLDGTWHRYDNYQRDLAAERHDAAKKLALTSSIEEAACDILMSQATLKKFSSRTLKELRKIRLEAEARAFDTPEACDQGDMLACDYYSKVELLKRMKQDIQALKMPRDSFTAYLE